MQKDNKRVLLNTIFLYVRMIFILLLSLYTTREVLHVLGVVDYGVYNVVAGFVSMFSFLNTSMINATQRYYNYEKGLGNKIGLRAVYNASLRTQLVLGIFTLLLLELVGVWYVNEVMVLPEERLEAANWVFQTSVISLLFVILQIPYSSAVVSHEKMNFYAFVGIVDAVLRVGIVIILPHLSLDSLKAYGILMLCVSLFNFCVYFLYAKVNFNEIRFDRQVDYKLLKQIASFSGWNVFDSFAFMMQGQGLNVLMNAFYGPVVNAARGITYQIQGAVYNFSSNIGMAFKPQLVESYAKENYSRTKGLFYTMSKMCFFMQYVLSIPIMLELDYILKIWIGTDVPEYTHIFTILILIHTIVNSFNMPMTQVVHATGNIKRYLFFRSLLTLSVIPVSLLSIKIWGSPIVVFVTMIVITLLMQPVSLYLLHRVFEFNYREYFKTVIFPSVLFAVLMPIPLVLCNKIFEIGIIRLSSILFLAVISSIICGYYILLTKSERKDIINMIRSKIGKKHVN